MGVRNDAILVVDDEVSSIEVADIVAVSFASGDTFWSDDVNGFDVFSMERYKRRISNGLSIFCADAAVAVALDDVMTFRAIRV